MKKVIIVCRVSSASQVDGTSLSTQLDEIKRYCQYKNYEIVDEIFEEGVSGKCMTKRGQFSSKINKMIESQDIDTLVSYSLSRVSRSLKDLIILIDKLSKKGKNIETIKEGLNSAEMIGKLIIGILGSVNEFEREQTVDRIITGKVKSVVEKHKGVMNHQKKWARKNGIWTKKIPYTIQEAMEIVAKRESDYTYKQIAFLHNRPVHQIQMIVQRQHNLEYLNKYIAELNNK